MFDNIGGKIKGLAMVLCWLGIIGFVIFGIVQMSMSKYLIGTGLLTMVIGGLASWIGSWLLYGFGELISKKAEINTKLNWILSTMQKGFFEKKGTDTGTSACFGNESEEYNLGLGNKDKKAVQAQSDEEGYIVCSLCGMKQPINRTVCWKCGAKFDKEEKQS